MFRKKRPVADDASRPMLRGRGGTADIGTPGSKGHSNPLARRFEVDAEPPTIELTGPASVHHEPEPEEDPKTGPLQTNPADLSRVITHDPETGKFYLHPGGPKLPVTLQGEPVRAPTELRSGDSVCVGGVEIHFGQQG